MCRHSTVYRLKSRASTELVSLKEEDDSAGPMIHEAMHTVGVACHPHPQLRHQPVLRQNTFELVSFEHSRPSLGQHRLHEQPNNECKPGIVGGRRSLGWSWPARASNGDARASSRGYGGSRDGRDASLQNSSGVRDRPSGPYRGRGSSYNDSQERRYNSRENVRDSGGYRGGYRDSGRGYRRYPQKKMHRGAYTIEDEETGEKVIVWGVEDQDELPRPTPSDLKWKPTKVAMSGDPSDENWYKAMENAMGGPSGADSGRSARQGGVSREEEEEEEEEEDDDELYEDSDFDDSDEEENSSGSALRENLLKKEQTQKVSRPAKVRLFGRDFGGKPFVKSEVAEGGQPWLSSGPPLPGDFSKRVYKSVKINSGVDLTDRESACFKGEDLEEERLNGQDGGDNLPAGVVDDTHQPWPPIGPLTSTTSDRLSLPVERIQTALIDTVDSGDRETSNLRGEDLQEGRLNGQNAVGNPFKEVMGDTYQPWPPIGSLMSGISGRFTSNDESTETALNDSAETPEKVTQHERVRGADVKDNFQEELEVGKEVTAKSQSWPPRGAISDGSFGIVSVPVESSTSASNKRNAAPFHDLNMSREVFPPLQVGEVRERVGNKHIPLAKEKIHGDTNIGISSPHVFHPQSDNTGKASKVGKMYGGARDAQWQGMNPGIIDITEDEEQESRSAPRAKREIKGDNEGSNAIRPGFLNELRIQTHREFGSKSELQMPALVKAEKGNGSSAMEIGVADSELSEIQETDKFAARGRGVRDLDARTNFDPSLVDEFFSLKSFKDVGATEEVIQALAALQVSRPSAIQAMAFKPVSEGQSCIIADQTGSGKTLAYVAPLVQRLRDEEAKGAANALREKQRILVLVPTSELAVQLLNVCRAFSKGGAPFRSIILTGGFKWKTQEESLKQGADVVVATPGRFLQHLKAGTLQLDNLKCVVLDEVDILFDDEEFSEVLQMVERSASNHVQYVHVTATLPVDIHDSLLKRYPDSLPLMGPSLHRTAVGLQEILVDCSNEEGEEKTPETGFVSKRESLLQLVDQRPVSKTIIFCNKIETCRKVENALARHDRRGTKLTVLPYHAALSQEARLESMQQFMETQLKTSLFLVCTDRASRGLDSFDVEHVVLFDFPRDPSEYVRRVGRTARGAGGTGKVFVFALGKQVAMARRIMTRNEKGHPVHTVPGIPYQT